MIADFLAALLKVNLAGGAAVLLVVARRRTARRLFGVQAAYRLWAVVFLAGVAVLLPARTMTAPAYAAPSVLAGPAFAAASPGAPTPMAVPAAAPSDFFWKQVDAQASFAASSGGQAPYVVLHQGAGYSLGQRIS
jgi:beta-lactamase regulating signal transducer with metallopeptidase domain